MSFRVLPNFWEHGAQIIVTDDSGAVLGFHHEEDKRRVMESIKDGDYSSFADWWRDQYAIWRKAYGKCNHDLKNFIYPDDCLLRLVGFRHFRDGHLDDLPLFYE